MAKALETPPSNEELKQLLGASYSAWNQLQTHLLNHYPVQILWAQGGKAGVYECKFRCSSRTLCAFYAREDSFGFLMIFGGEQRERFESAQGSFAGEIRREYQAARTYSDGKWVMFDIRDESLLGDLIRLLAIKRAPRPAGEQASGIEKVDFKKRDRELYRPSSRPVLVEVPRMNFIMVDGCGDPREEDYQNAVEILYTLCWTIKMSGKNGQSPPGYFEYVLPPLEGLWHSPGGTLDLGARDGWRWTSMIRQPEFVTPQVFAQAVEACKAKKPGPDYSRARFESFEEGLCAQMLHLGPYTEERASLLKIGELIEGKQLRDCSGEGRKHHEIYLSDPRKTAPERLKTLLRLPVEPV